ncbi:YraN family protein [bacterium]|nr:YraN family protein [bacterium]
MKQTKTITQKLGEEGEKLALHFLRSEGLTILETNWRAGHLELDIIAKSCTELVIVEVKTRGTEIFGYPEGAVSKSKQKRMSEATEEYLFKHNIDLPVRYDIIAVILNSRQLKIDHFPDAFFPGVY